MMQYIQGSVEFFSEADGRTADKHLMGVPCSSSALAWLLVKWGRGLLSRAVVSVPTMRRDRTSLILFYGIILVLYVT